MREAASAGPQVPYQPAATGADCGGVSPRCPAGWLTGSVTLLMLVTACVTRPPVPAAPGAVSAPPSPAPAAESAATAPRVAVDTTRFEREIQAFEAADRAAPPQPGGILFVGSSSIRLWPDLAGEFPGRAVLNRGFGGSTLAEVTHYAPRIIFPYRPRQIVVYAGDNDLASGMTPAEVAADYRRLVALVRRELPSARIAYISVKPSPSRWHLVEAYREANRLIAAEAARDSTQAFIDVFTPMLGATGRPRPELFLGDSLHMTRAGYDVWRARVGPALR